MKPYYDHKGITIYCGDCREILPQLEFDLIVTDPQYEKIVGGYNRTPLSGVAKRINPSISVGQLWQNIKGWEKIAIQAARFGIVVFCSHKTVDLLPQAFSELRKVCLFSWEETNAAPTGKNVPRFTTQFAWVLSKGGYDWGSIKKTHFTYPHEPGGCMKTTRPNHPCPKPLSLMRDLLNQFDASLLLGDPFMGSGTTLVAAKALGRKAIGIEIEEKYCEIAVKRLAQEILPLRQNP
jgi:DNA modification methylase